MSNNLFKENYSGPIFMRRVFNFMNAAGRCLNNVRGINGCVVTPNEFGGLDISVSGSSSSARPFRVSSVNNQAGTAAISGGMIIHGTTRITVAAATVAIGGGTLAEPSYAVVRYIYGESTAIILPATVSGNSILPTLTEWKQPLASFYRLAGKIYIKEVLWDSIIILPAVYSP